LRVSHQTHKLDEKGHKAENYPFEQHSKIKFKVQLGIILSSFHERHRTSIQSWMKLGSLVHFCQCG